MPVCRKTACCRSLKTVASVEVMPEFEDDKVSTFFDAVIEAGLEGSALPECNPEYWKRLTLYLNTLLPQENK